MATLGDTVIYTTACCSASPVGDGSFTPLQVHYQERFSAAGRTRYCFAFIGSLCGVAVCRWINALCASPSSPLNIRAPSLFLRLPLNTHTHTAART
jgi:hypothetical protein